MQQKVQEILHHTFGYREFRGQQQAIIKTVIDKQDALVLMPTGGGKSLCYQIPALLDLGLVIVISPLIALMQDQVTGLLQLGVKAAYLNSTLALHEQNTIMRSIHDNTLDILYIAPERLLKEHTLQRLMSVEVGLIAIDEAHCVSQWGHDFREDYLGLHVLKEAFVGVPRMALTATADAKTQKEIVLRLALTDHQVFVSSFDRSNIRYLVQSKTQPKQQLLAYIAQQKDTSGIIYCMSRKRVEMVTHWLQNKGYRARAYHAGLPSQERAQNQHDFLHDKIQIMVATVAFGMGIDKPDVRFVAHFDLPKNLEAYYQETGRAGRDGQPSQAWMLYGVQDVMRNLHLLQESTASQAHKLNERNKAYYLLAWCEITECRRQPLLTYFGEQSTPCGNCDNCLTPPITWDASVAAQKLLSCIYRMGQSFGAQHVLHVLRGVQNEKVLQHHHDELSTFGIGEAMSDTQWRSVLRQLIIKKYITVNHQQYDVLQLNESSRAVLKSEVRLLLRQDTELTKTKVSKQPIQSDVLWDALKVTRLRLAQENNLPPFHIFHDASLQQMHQQKPKTSEQMLQISGVGAVKFARYGEEFLAVIKQYST